MGHRVKPSPCPNCGNINDGATVTQGEDVLPKPGDICVCIYCAKFAVYDEQLELAKMSEETMELIKKKHPDLYKELLRVQTAATIYNLRRPKKE